MGRGPWRFVLDLLFPPKCVFCTALLEDPEGLLCPKCQRELPWLRGKEGQQKIEFAAMCVSVLRYQGDVRESVRRFKFRGESWYAKVYGTLMAQCVQDQLQGRYDEITWVPVSRRRNRERGYDQDQLLAREMGKCLGHSPCRLLRKVRSNPPQSGLKDAAARRANVMGAYAAATGEQIAGKRILLVDDVVTTGETLSECARTLRMAGAAEVVCVTLARAR